MTQLKRFNPRTEGQSTYWKFARASESRPVMPSFGGISHNNEHESFSTILAQVSSPSSVPNRNGSVYDFMKTMHFDMMYPGILSLSGIVLDRVSPIHGSNGGTMMFSLWGSVSYGRWNDVLSDIIARSLGGHGFEPSMGKWNNIYGRLHGHYTLGPMDKGGYVYPIPRRSGKSLPFIRAMEAAERYEGRLGLGFGSLRGGADYDGDELHGLVSWGDGRPDPVRDIKEFLSMGRGQSLDIRG